jgi:hypothetical protein
MSNGSLLDARIRWGKEAQVDDESSDTWFEKFDQLLRDVDLNASLAVRQDAEIWYVVSDADMITPVDPTPTFGLDTWDF